MSATTARIHWSSRIAFVLAAAGSAIGLGNIWKFPYIAGQNGGGAFVLIYLLTIAIVGIPIMIAELYIGQSAQKNAVQAFEATHKTGTPWKITGLMGVVAAFIILSFYGVVGGWVLDFEFRSIMNEFGRQSVEQNKAVLGSLFENPLRIIFWQFVFMCLTIGIVLGGIKKGIEKWNKFLMPALMMMLVGLLIHAFTLNGFGEAFTFLFSPDWEKLTFAKALEAVGHSFFTLSLGLGAMITYGSYLSRKEDLVKTAFLIAFMDTAIAITAGLVIFSVVYSFQLEPSAGPALIFVTLPMLFSQMPGGQFLSIVFFLLVSFAALTSAVSLLEPVITYWTETHRLNRKKATIVMGVLIFALGIPSALSFNVMAGVKFFDYNFFDLADKLTTNIMMPVGGLLISLFYGWVLGPKAAKSTLRDGSRGTHLAALGLMWTARVVSPLAVFYVLYNGISELIA